MKEYKEFYINKYGDSSKTPPHALNRRKQYIENLKREELKNLPNTLKNLRMKRIAKQLKNKYLFEPDTFRRKEIPDGPLSLNKFQMEIYREFLIRFKLSSGKKVCHNAVELKRFIDNSGDMREPTTGEFFTQDQLKRIYRIYDRVCPDKPSAHIYRQNILASNSS